MSSPMLPLTGRVALITGASRTNGIGFAVARRLGRMGAKLFLHGWPSSAETLVDRGPGPTAVGDALESEGIAVRYAEADFLDPAAPEAIVKVTVDAYGHLDIVDANDAYLRPDRLETLDAAELDRHLSINVRGSLMLAKAFAAQHAGRPGGCVVLMTWGQHLGFYDPDMVSYMVSKGAVH